MMKGVVKPCQMLRLKSGSVVCSAAPAASSNRGRTVYSGTMPTARHNSTRISTGTFIHRGGSWGVFGISPVSGPRKASATYRIE